MITLHGFGENFGVADPSSFVLKVDAYLRKSGIEYQYDGNGFANMKVAPKGKLPFIKDGDQVIADSTAILSYLEDKYQVGMDDWLTEEQRGICHLVAKSLDENLYWCIVYSRWMLDDTWPKIKDVFFSEMPFPLKFFVPVLAKLGVQSSLKKHGIGLHSHDEIITIYKDTLISLSKMLGGKPYIFGDKSCSLDMVIYACLAQVVLVSFDNEFNQIAKTHQNLIDFTNRIHQEFYA